MKGNKKIVEMLNDVLTHELTSVNQYFLHAKMCESWGYLRLHEYIRREAIGEMKHADALIERILYLEGAPNVQRLSKINVGETVSEQLRLDRDLEIAAVTLLNKGIALCAQVGDNGSREMLEEILEEEEEHLDWLKTQLSLIATVGEEHYLAQQVRKPEE
jgi:bacterioferritin